MVATGLFEEGGGMNCHGACGVYLPRQALKYVMVGGCDAMDGKPEGNSAGEATADLFALPETAS